MLRNIIVFFLLSTFCIPVYANDNMSLIHFEGTVALPKNGYLFGKADVESNGLAATVPAFSKGGNVFVLVPAEAPIGSMPKLKINGLGFNGSKNIVIGAYDSEDGMGAWVLSFLVSGDDNITIADYVKHASLDGYVYDFYTNIPSIDAPKDITDADKDGKREIELDFYTRRFRMLLEVDSGILSLDNSSQYYQKTFKSVKKIEGLDEYQFREYLLYGIFTKKLTPTKALELYMEKNKMNMVNIPDIISSSVELKNISTELGVTNFMVEFLMGDITMDMLQDKLPKDSVAYSKFTEQLLLLDEKLKNARMDEEAFNDFLLFFSNSITEDEFTDFAKKSLVDLNGDIYSILMNHSALNAILHTGFPLRIIKLTTLANGNQGR